MVVVFCRTCYDFLLVFHSLVTVSVFGMYQISAPAGPASGILANLATSSSGYIFGWICSAHRLFTDRSNETSLDLSVFE